MTQLSLQSKRIYRGFLAALALTGAALFAASSVGCSAPPSDAAVDSAQEPLTEVTSVELLADGTSRARTVQLTAAELAEEVRIQQQFLAQRAASPSPSSSGSEHVGEASDAITKDTVCGGASLWIYNVNASGCENPAGMPDGGRILCFKGTGTANLHDYGWLENPCLPAGDPHCTPMPVNHTWDYQVVRYWPGVDAGGFWDSSCVGWRCFEEHFTAWQACTAAGSIAQGSNMVCLGSGC